MEPDERGERMATVMMYRNSLLKLIGLDVVKAFPGHGKPFIDLDKLIQSRLSRIEEKAGRMEALIAKSLKTPFEMALLYYPSELSGQFYQVMSSVVGTLDYLELTGRVHKKLKSGVWHYIKAV